MKHQWGGHSTAKLIAFVLLSLLVGFAVGFRAGEIPLANSMIANMQSYMHDTDNSTAP